MCGSVAGYWTRAGGGAVVVIWTFLTLSSSAGGRYQSPELFYFIFQSPELANSVYFYSLDTHLKTSEYCPRAHCVGSLVVAVGHTSPLLQSVHTVSAVGLETKEASTIYLSTL